MKATIAAAVALASTVAATNDWVNALSFACPSNTNNQCNNQQSTGFDWSSLGLGSFSQYGDFDFNGWSCSSSFGSAKRDMLTGRTFQPKCITGTATSDTSKAPSFGCGSSKDVTAFSVTEVEISVEFDCDLEFHYGMEDGSTCKQRSSCSSGGSVVKNSQCGGAKSVTVVYPSQTAGSGKGKDSCSIGVHSVGFDCSTASSTVHRTTAKETSKITTKSTTTTSAQVTTTSTAEVETTSSSTAAASTSVSFANTTSTAQTTSVAQTTQSTTAFTTSTVFTTFVSTIISCAATVTDCPAHSTALTTVTVALSTTICPVTETETSPATSVAAISSAAASSVIASTAAASTTEIVSSAAASTSSVAGIATTSSAAPSEVITTVVIETSTTLCPVTLTHTTGSSTHLETTVSTSTVLLTKTSTVCTKCEQTATSVAQISTSTTSTAQAAATTAACPDVLPQCLNTWLFSLGCSSNADVDCFCPDATFITNVFDCVTAHGASSSEITTAQNYLQGICASYIPSNPAIVTAVTTLPPDTTGTAAGTITYSNIPVTTVQVFTTLVVPCTESTGISAGSVIPSSSTTTVISTQVAVPQVVFQTFTGTGTASISAALVQGTAPAAVSAQTTFAAPAQTTFQTASSTANGTLTASPATFTGGSSVNTVAFGTLGAAVLFALMVI